MPRFALRAEVCLSIVLGGTVLVGLPLRGQTPEIVRGQTPEVLARDAEGLMAQGRPTEAVPLLRRAAADAPSDPRILSLLGQALFETDPAESLDPLAKAARALPDDGPTQFTFGAALLETGDPDGSFQVLTRLVKAEPGEAASRAYLMRAAFRSGRQQEALAQLDWLRTNLGGDGPFQAQLAEWCFQEAPAKVAGGQIAFALVRAAQPALQARLAYLQGTLRLKAGDPVAATERFNEAARLDPGREEYARALLGARIAVAQKLMEGGDSAAAHRLAGTLERQLPGHPDILLLQGRLALSDQHYEDARRSLETALRKRPGDPDILFYLSGALERLERPADALAVIERAAAAAPRDARTWLARGRLLLRLERLEESLAALDQARILDPVDRSAYLLSAQALRRLGRAGQAREILRQLAERERASASP